jgi:YbgC/YbaW family acyl-CoA thioester hydrolase
MPETPSIKYAYQVMFFDTDCAGVVHNLAYLRMIETARTLLAEQLGLDMVSMGQQGIFPALLRTEVDYRRSAKLSDKLLVRGRLDALERIRFWVTFEVVDSTEAITYVTCRQSLALIQLPASKPMRLPEDWARRFAHLR